MKSKAENIYDNFLFKLSKKTDHSYWMVDIKENNTTPKLVVEKHGETLSRWRVVIFSTNEDLVSGYRSRKEAVAMAEFKLANKLAGSKNET